MSPPFLTRRAALGAGLRLATAAVLGARFLPMKLPAQSTGAAGTREFDVGDFGAAGDGTTLDTAAIQRAIDAAAAATGPTKRARVLVRGGKRYLVGSLVLQSGIDFHLADDAELLVSTDEAHFPNRAVVSARDAVGLRFTGTGRINGRSREFMTHFDETDEWWRPKPFRPRLMVLTGCKDLELHDLTLFEAPSWSLHLVGCERVLVDRMKIRNQLDVPNCDGIDPDHCRDVVIRNCDIECGDDAIVVKATRQGAAYGGSSNIRVHDCVLNTQDSGVKIGTETVADIHDIVFERCRITSSCRGCTIQLRDQGSVYDVDFRDITFVSRYHSAPWWGRGEAISFTAIPRNAETTVGAIRDIRVRNITGRAENSLRLSGCPTSRLKNISLENVDLTFERWTKYPGAVWDNRPTTAGVFPDLEPHPTAAFHVRHADDVTLRDCRVRWGANPPDYYSHALEAHDVTNLLRERFVGEAAHPARDAAVKVS